jgi:NAD(P)-dependent dehydrogenase (short-subunit alcohol dehydrogenase family)
MNLNFNPNQGIGAACAIALAQAGAALCLVLREPQGDAPPNLDTVNAIRELGATAEVIHCDLNNLDAVKGVFQRALDVMGGRIDILVNCAGIQRRSPSLDFLETDWDDVRTRYAPHLSFNLLIIDHALSYFTPRPLHFVYRLLSRSWT